MKIINKILIGSATAMILFSSCTEDQLTSEPSGGTITKDQNEEIMGTLPDRVNSLVSGVYSWFVQFNSLNIPADEEPRHSDFGYATIMLSSDLWGQDMVQTGSKYNWFWGDQIYNNRTYNLQDMYYHWNFLYRLIDKANGVLKMVTPENEESLATSVAKVRAVRAFAYFNLVQLYQHTYKGHESAPAVPIVTETTTQTEAANNPRASVQAVYDFILEDLNYAVKELDTYKRGTAKFEIDKNVANGLLARVYLTMEKWSEAATAADLAMGGYTPMSGDEYNDPKTGFNEISNHAWIWGSDINENNRVVTSGIINFPSHIGSLNYGYVTAGKMFKAMSKGLYDKMSLTDIRRKAYADDKGKVVIPEGTTTLAPYANIKFRPYQGTYGTSTNANDIPLMRVEEMYLIKAEAIAMGGDPAGGKAILEAFVKTYRDPSYTCTASSAQEVQDAVWLQRRLELWGEGISWFDLKRLKKGTDRKYAGSNFDEKAAQINLPAEHGLFLLPIPLKELQSNNGISESDNNPNATPPR